MLGRYLFKVSSLTQHVAPKENKLFSMCVFDRGGGRLRGGRGVKKGNKLRDRELIYLEKEYDGEEKMRGSACRRNR